ncbi:hypothetical protein AVI56_01195 [Piscirickettsia salmonis]|uniref:hypothetical protein n=1 Tax=Piscirickettsia salmonis TaxID=1238 RepID=UPI00094A4575|nr:hypothetical protein [Piscirickettsia salmonis]APS69096.1 hypothetical protein AVI56_01195 [Piscirickettsia salmonis]
MLKLNILKWGKIKSQDAQKILKNVGSTVVFPSKYVDKKYKVKEVDGQLKLVRSDWLGKLRNFFGKDTQQEAMNLTLNSARKLTKKEVKLTENNSKKDFQKRLNLLIKQH